MPHSKKVQAKTLCIMLPSSPPQKFILKNFSGLKYDLICVQVVLVGNKIDTLVIMFLVYSCFSHIKEFVFGITEDAYCHCNVYYAFMYHTTCLYLYFHV